MEFKDFPMLSADVLVLKSDESVDGFQAGQAIQLLAYQDVWLAGQGHQRVRVRCAASDESLFPLLALRDQTRWLLNDKQSAKLLVQYCAPVEVSPMQCELGVDELNAEDLYNKQEIADNKIDLACQWLADNFVVSGFAEGDWLAVARFTNSAARGGFQLIGKGWRADVEQTA